MMENRNTKVKVKVIRYLIKPVQVLLVTQKDIGLETVLIVGVNTSTHSTVW